MTGRRVTRYRGQEISRNDSVNPGRRGRYTWSGRPFSLLTHAKCAIDDHCRDRDRATGEKETAQ